jgi:ABC-type cobalt transport system substrate-binding protein
MKRRRRKAGRIIATACLGVLVVLIVAPLIAAGARAEGAQEKQSWQGVDEVVVEKIAREQGRVPWPPVLFRTDLGDLPLLMFLLAGTVAGFAAGYYWRKLLEGRKK